MRDNIGLFRGKRLDNGEWVEGFFVTWPDMPRAWILKPFCKVSMCDRDVSGTINKYEVDPATVGQFTGLTDRNGKRIFEGDVLLDSYDEMAGTVTYRPDDGMFAFISNEDEMYDFADVDSKSFEVIGTIHDKEAT